MDRSDLIINFSNVTDADPVQAASYLEVIRYSDSIRTNAIAGLRLQS